MRRRSASAAAALAAAVSLAACTGGSNGSGDVPASPGSGTPTVSAYPSGAATGVIMTEPGAQLSLGQDATVAWQPRQGLVGTVRIRVERIERTTFARSFRDWRVDKATASYTPYLVRASLTNLAANDPGGQAVPLYGQSAAGALVEPASFRTTFKPCHPSTLPTPFATGSTTTACLVYLVPNGGELVGVAFRPTEDFQPIVWSGPVTTLGARKR